MAAKKDTAAAKTPEPKNAHGDCKMVPEYGCCPGPISWNYSEYMRKTGLARMSDKPEKTWFFYNNQMREVDNDTITHTLNFDIVDAV